MAIILLFFLLVFDFKFCFRIRFLQDSNCVFWVHKDTKTSLGVFVCRTALRLQTQRVRWITINAKERKSAQKNKTGEQWTKFNFSLGCSSCLQHKARTCEMGSNVIIIQTWWAAFYLNEQFTSARPTTMLSVMRIGLLWAVFFKFFFKSTAILKKGRNDWIFSNIGEKAGICRWCYTNYLRFVLHLFL